MTSIYTDPAYIAARRWEHLTELFGPPQLAALLAERGVSESEVRFNAFDSFGLIEHWERTFVERIRGGYGTRFPPGLAGIVVRTLELVLELNIRLSRPVRIRPGLHRWGFWRCRIYGDSNTDPQRPWRVAIRFPHEYCFVIASDEGYGLSWAEAFSGNVETDGRLFMGANPKVPARYATFDRRYCIWLAGLLDHALAGFVPCFYWPGYDGHQLSATRLVGIDAPEYPLPRSPWS